MRLSVTGGGSATKAALADRAAAAGAAHTPELTRHCSHLLVVREPGAGVRRAVSAKERAARAWRDAAASRGAPAPVRVVWAAEWLDAVLARGGYDRALDADYAVPQAAAGGGGGRGGVGDVALRLARAASRTPAPGDAGGAVVAAPAAPPPAPAPAPAREPTPPPRALSPPLVAPGDPDAMFLDGARVFLTGTRDAGERRGLLAVARAGGATLERTLHPAVTHAVVGGGATPDEADALRAHVAAHPGATAVVGGAWLAACGRGRSLAPAAPHALDPAALARPEPLSGLHFTLAALAGTPDAADAAAAAVVRAGGRTFDGATARAVDAAAAYALCPPGLPPGVADALTASCPDFALVPAARRVTLAWVAASAAARAPLPARALRAAPGAPPAPPLTPLPHSLPLPDFAGLKLCASGLPSTARDAAAALARALGAGYSDAMRRSTTHLLVPTRAGEKFERAAEFGVAPVTPAWLAACGAAGRRVPEAPFFPPPAPGSVVAIAVARTPGGGEAGPGGEAAQARPRARRVSGLAVDTVARAVVGSPAPGAAATPRARRATPGEATPGVAAAAPAPRPPPASSTGGSASAAATPAPPGAPRASSHHLSAAFDVLESAVAAAGGPRGGAAPRAASRLAGTPPSAVAARAGRRRPAGPDSQNSDPRKRARRGASPAAAAEAARAASDADPPPPPDCSQLVAYDAAHHHPADPAAPAPGGRPRGARADADVRRALARAVAGAAAGAAPSQGGADVLADMGLAGW